VLTRADSFKAVTQHPIVANAQQMLIVASLREPRVKWGLVDRMIVAARSGGLHPVVCLNKIDLADPALPALTADPAGDGAARAAAISRFNDKGRHTTTSARRYVLDFGGAVIDTPGVKLFGLWGVSRENLLEFFPDVDAGTAPEWRKESYERIADSLPEPPPGG